MKNLIIITHDMANGNWLLDELEFHKVKEYSNILVFNTKAGVHQDIESEGMVKYYYLTYNRIHLLIEMVFSFFQPELFKEVVTICRKKRVRKLSCIQQALIYMAMSRVYAKKIHRILEYNGISKDDNNLFYSYWMSVQAETFFYLKKKYPKGIFVSRCHSIDIYEERSKNNYLEYRQQLIDLLKSIYCISTNAKEYFEQLYICKNKCKLAKLGSFSDFGLICEEKSQKHVFKIVSCSSIIEVKRLHLIVEALAQIKEYPIVWHHYGTGHLEKELCHLAGKLPANINYEFKGFVKHPQLLEMYVKEGYDLFINVSEIEGIPVSMMEAMSVGIPVLGPRVGGVPEIVKDGENGYLFDKDGDITELSEYIMKFVNMTDEEYSILRKNCYQFWNENHNMQINYKKFAEDIMD